MNSKKCEKNGRLRYFVGKGNSSRLIRSQFHHRKNWKPALLASEVAALNDGKGLKKVSDVRSNFLWTTYRCRLDFNQIQAPKSKYQTVPGRKLQMKATDRVVVNHFEANRCLVSKRGLYETLLPYEAQQQEKILPQTFILHTGLNTTLTENSSFKKFAEFVSKQENFGIWIIKPGHTSNRGCDIKIVKSIDSLVKSIEEVSKKRNYKSWIIQKYIERPLLKDKRKFDIRCFVLLTYDQENQLFCGMIHRNAYLRLSSKIYSLKKLNDRGIHLTNDAVQQKLSSYGKFEQGNKLSLEDFAIYMDDKIKDANISGHCLVFENLWPKIKNIVKLTLEAAIPKLREGGKADVNCFELFGFDFMLDSDLNLFLIEVNENPCLEMSSPILERYIPELISDTFTVVLDNTYFPDEISPSNPMPKGNNCPQGKMQDTDGISERTDNGYENLLTISC